MQPKQLAKMIKNAAEDKKAEEPVILDVAKMTTIAHYFFIAHGNSERQVKAISDNILDELKKKGMKAYHTEGLDNCRWVLIDFGSVLAHIFYRETREFYGLERLWGEAAATQ